MTGEQKLNGRTKTKANLARVMGYVEQFDVHTAPLTVIESLTFSAHLRMDRSVNNRSEAMFVENVRFPQCGACMLFTICTCLLHARSFCCIKTPFSCNMIVQPSMWVGSLTHSSGVLGKRVCLCSACCQLQVCHWGVCGAVRSLGQYRFVSGSGGPRIRLRRQCSITQAAGGHVGPEAASACGQTSSSLIR